MVGQNFGSKNFDRIYEAFLISLRLSLIMMIFGAVVLIFAGERIASFFSRDSEVIIIAGSYLFMVAFFGFYISSY